MNAKINPHTFWAKLLKLLSLLGKCNIWICFLSWLTTVCAKNNITDFWATLLPCLPSYKTCNFTVFKVKKAAVHFSGTCLGFHAHESRLCAKHLKFWTVPSHATSSSNALSEPQIHLIMETRHHQNAIPLWLTPKLFPSLLAPSFFPSIPPSFFLCLVPDDLFWYRRTPSGQYFGDAGPPADGRHPSGAPLPLRGNRVDPLEVHPLLAKHTHTHIPHHIGNREAEGEKKSRWYWRRNRGKNKGEWRKREEKRARLISVKPERKTKFYGNFISLKVLLLI